MIRLRPDNGNFYFERGNAYRKLGKEAQAQADFDKAKQLGYTGPQ
jgi:Flp pilus assembly protein TadD